MNERKAWVASLKTIRSWSKYLETDYDQHTALQIGLLDHYSELMILSKELGRKIPSWVVKYI